MQVAGSRSVRERRCVGWAVVGFLSLRAYIPLDRKSIQTDFPPDRVVTSYILLGCGLYYGILVFNLTVSFWIGESLLGITGLLIYLPLTVLLALRRGMIISGV